MRNAVLHTFERDLACRSSMQECFPCNSHRFGHKFCRCQVLRITSVACEIFMLFVFQRNTHPHNFVLRLRRPQCDNIWTTHHMDCTSHTPPRRCAQADIVSVLRRLSLPEPSVDSRCTHHFWMPSSFLRASMLDHDSMVSLTTAFFNLYLDCSFLGWAVKSVH